MSIHRLCDCPDCHGYDELASAIVDDDYAVFGGRDICGPCLRAEWGCTYWQVRVLPQPSQLELMMNDIWSPVIYKQLLLKDWDKYTQNRVKHAKDAKGKTVNVTVHQTRED